MNVTKEKTAAELAKAAAVAALRNALDDRGCGTPKRPGLAGVRALATGVVLYGAGFAAFKRLGGDGRGQEEPPPAAEAERGIGKRGAPPSLELPRQRWTRIPVGHA